MKHEIKKANIVLSFFSVYHFMSAIVRYIKKVVPKVYEYNRGWGSLRFISRKAVNKIA